MKTLFHLRGPAFAFQSCAGRHMVGHLRLWPWSFYWARVPDYPEPPVVAVSHKADMASYPDADWAAQFEARIEADRKVQVWQAVNRWLSGENNRLTD